MTTVNDFVDILRIIREQPEWGDALRSALLSKEVLELPQRLAEFAEAFNTRLDRLEGDVTGLKGDVAELKAGQARLEGDVTGLKGDVAELKTGQARLEGDVTGLKGDVAELKTGQARLEGDVTGLKGDVAELKTGQARLEGDVTGLKGDVAELKAGQARLEGDVSELKAGQARLEGDVSELKAGQARLEKDVSELKVGHARLEGDVSELKSDVAELKVGQGRLEGAVGNLRGAAYEQKVANNIATIVRRPLGIRRVRLVKGHGATDAMTFHDLMDAAEDRGIITGQERVEAGSADLVIRGERHPDQSTIYVAVEISVTAADSDINRAADRSDLLRRATGRESESAIVSAHIDLDRQRLAEEKNVTLISFGE